MTFNSTTFVRRLAIVGVAIIASGALLCCLPTAAIAQAAPPAQSVDPGTTSSSTFPPPTTEPPSNTSTEPASTSGTAQAVAANGGATIADWTEAIGTIFAAIVALGLGLWPGIQSRRRSPRLEFAATNVYPSVFSRDENGPTRTIGVRLNVRNVGESHASNVRVVATWAWTKQRQADELSAAYLANRKFRWSGRPSNTTTPADFSQVLPAKSDDYCDVFDFRLWESKAVLLGLGGTNVPIQVPADVDTYVEFVAIADNAKPVSMIVQFRFSMASPYVATSVTPERPQTIYHDDPVALEALSPL